MDLAQGSVKDPSGFCFLFSRSREVRDEYSSNAVMSSPSNDEVDEARLRFCDLGLVGLAGVMNSSFFALWSLGRLKSVNFDILNCCQRRWKVCGALLSKENLSSKINDRLRTAQ